jgi:L-lactate dehydrogenase complex protein LldG
MTEARAAVLSALRRALDGAGPAAPVPRAYLVHGDRSRPEVLDRFAERVEDYRATVFRSDEAGVPAAVAAALGRAAAVVVPADLDRRWLPDHVTVHADDPADPLGIDVLDSVDAVVTAAAVGIAETGTVVLDGGAGQGRRAVSLVPDLHVCVVRADQVVATVPEAVRRLEPTRPQTWISGPSATSDIELDRVEGVHGPRTLHVVLVDTTGPAGRATG